MGERLTESDVQKIKEEIEYRKLVVRKKELAAVKEARAHGDLSENFEYKAAKQDMLVTRRYVSVSSSSSKYTVTVLLMPTSSDCQPGDILEYVKGTLRAERRDKG